MRIEWNQKVNSLPVPTFRRQGVNEGIMKLEGEFCAMPLCVPERIPEGVQILTEDRAEWNSFAEKESVSAAWKTETGMGENTAAFLKEHGCGKVLIYAEEGEKVQDPVRLIQACGDGEFLGREILVYGAKDSELTVILFCESPEDSRGLLGDRILIRAEEGARIHLLKAQLLGEDYECFEDIGGSCGEGGEIQLTWLPLGGRQIWNGCRVDLEGTGSCLNVRTGCFRKKGQKLDINYHVIHQGKNTQSRMEAQEILGGEAEKIFRGTIDLKRGASGAEGEEQEDVLLLGKNAVNKTVPLILCGEENVVGNHGATIGRLDDQILYYMGSRGIGEKEARRLLIQSRIGSIAEKIPEQGLRERIASWLEEVLENAG